MGLELFQVAGGYSDGRISYLSGTTAPGGDASFQDAAAPGSIYSLTTSYPPHLYKKVDFGSGTDKWIRLLDSLDLAGLGGGTGGSWREPAVLADFSYTTLSALTTYLNTNNALQGVAIAASSRILLGGLSSNKNVYIVSGSTGAWTLTEDIEQETVGDTVKIILGTYAKKEFTYVGTQWLWTNEDTDAEDQYLRIFMGKPGSGSSVPDFSSTNYIVDGDNLTVALGKLDAAIFASASNIATVATSVTTLGSEVDQIEASVGLNSSGQFVAPIGSTYLGTAASIKNGLELLDAAIVSTAARKVADSPSNTSQVVDALKVDDVTVAWWQIIVSSTSAPQNRYSCELKAMHNGTATLDATEVDSHTVGILRCGSIAGLSISVGLFGSGTSQELRVTVSATSAVTVRTIRIRTE